MLAYPCASNYEIHILRAGDGFFHSVHGNSCSDSWSGASFNPKRHAPDNHSFGGLK